MQVLNFYAETPHYFDHIFPLWEGLEERFKGEFHVSDWVLRDREQARKHCKWGLFKESDLVLVSGYADYKANKGEIIYIEHGVGHSYSNGSSGYAGGIGKDRVVLFLNVNQRVHGLNMSAYPNVPQFIVGSPKMDKLHRHSAYNKVKPVVCVSFHWDCKVAPETMSAFPYYRSILKNMPKTNDFEFVLHAHPHIASDMQRWSKKWGVEFIPLFSDVIQRADIYVIDNSSTLYEFASTGKPVIVLNCPLYRKNVHHGLRFWEDISGLQVDSSRELLPAIYRTINDPNEFLELRQEITSRVYPYLGSSVARCCEVLKDFLTNR